MHSAFSALLAHTGRHLCLARASHHDVSLCSPTSPHKNYLDVLVMQGPTQHKLTTEISAESLVQRLPRLRQLFKRPHRQVYRCLKELLALEGGDVNACLALQPHVSHRYLALQPHVAMPHVVWHADITPSAAEFALELAHLLWMMAAIFGRLILYFLTLKANVSSSKSFARPLVGYRPYTKWYMLVTACNMRTYMNSVSVQVVQQPDNTIICHCKPGKISVSNTATSAVTAQYTS